MARKGILNTEEKAFEQRVLELFKNKRTGKITSGIVHHRSRRDLAAGAGVEDRRDDVIELPLISTRETA